MSKTAVYKILYKNTKPKALYELYMNSKKHSEATAAAAKISAKKGGKFTAHNGWIFGENLQLVKDRLIVQAWRAQGWNESDTDSIFMIYLEPKGKDTMLHAVHSNIPDKEFDGINKGWHLHYWGPWKKYLAGKPIKKHPTM
ncbi:MAG: SRPBCC domain-containing protein [Chitinophagales bacterium]